MPKEEKLSEVSKEVVDKIGEIAKLRNDYLDLLIQIPLSYQTHEMVQLRNQIAELKKGLAEWEERSLMGK